MFKAVYSNSAWESCLVFRSSDLNKKQELRIELLADSEWLLDLMFLTRMTGLKSSEMCVAVQEDDKQG